MEIRVERAVSTDFLETTAALSSKEFEHIWRVRSLMEGKVAPQVDGWWARKQFRHEIVAMFSRKGAGVWETNRSKTSHQVRGLTVMEMARIDPSVGTLYSVQQTLGAGCVSACASASQKRRWLPDIRRWKKIVSFALMEVDVRTITEGKLSTTCCRNGDSWILAGKKKWMGTGSFADLHLIWARDVDSHQPKAFLVHADNPGLFVQEIDNRLSQRVAHNGILALSCCRVPESDRLQGANSADELSEILKISRVGAAWFATGCQMGLYERALKWVNSWPGASTEASHSSLIRQFLVELLGNLTASQTLMLRLSQIQTCGRLSEEQSSLAKSYASSKVLFALKSVKALEVEVDRPFSFEMKRYVEIIEALYGHEGERGMNVLSLGKALIAEAKNQMPEASIEIRR